MSTISTWNDIPPPPYPQARSAGLFPDNPGGVNCHLHTPWSFSAFDSVEEIIEQASSEKLSVLGINDFNTTGGFDEWGHSCFRNGIFPLFNIEMIGLNRADRDKGLLVNDPRNPGRTYISGKGLAWPAKKEGTSHDFLERIRVLSNSHVEQMTRRMNMLLAEAEAGFSIDFGEMKERLTRGMVRERHLARMIRMRMDEVFYDCQAMEEFLGRISGAAVADIDPGDHASMENAIRNMLLKAGGRAFVEEAPEIFPETEMIRSVILDLGGIPTYPFLGDFSNGSYTHFESDPLNASKELRERGFFSVEFIPHRNEPGRLRDYIDILREEGFLITFGTEHNTPSRMPLGISASGGEPLDDQIAEAGLEGASIIAAHQYRYATAGRGYLDENGLPRLNEKEEFIRLGKQLIGYVNSLSK